jgi:hypothetical protein
MMLVEIKVQKIDNGYLVRSEYGYDVSDSSGNCIHDTCYFAGNFDAVRDQLALIGIKLQTARILEESDE